MWDLIVSVPDHCLSFYFVQKKKYNRNVPKFSDREVWANSVDPDQAAPRGAVWSGSTLFAILSALFGLVTVW